MDDDTGKCRECGAPNPPLRYQGNPRKYCSEACSRKFRRRSNEEYRERQRARSRAVNDALEASKPPRPRCRNCNTEIARREGASYCDAPACRTAKYHARQESLPRCSVGNCDYPVIARALCGSHYAVEWRAENLERSRETAKARRALKRGARVESFTSAEIYERDGWVCGICSEPIPRGAIWPDRLSVSLDHIIPISLGGEHSMANVQASHLGCNSRKGNRIDTADAAS